MVITKKHALIVEYLNEKNRYVSSNELAILLNVSTRTISRYIHDINIYLKKYTAEISSSKGMGYKFIAPKNSKNNIINECRRYINGFLDDDSNESRIQNIIRMFINNSCISISDISERLSLSISSTNKLITIVKEELKKYNLIIKSRPYYGSYIFGDEIDLRELIINYTIRSDENGVINVYLDDINEQNVREIEEIVKEYLMDKNIIISDKDFYLLVSKIIVSIFRSNMECYTKALVDIPKSDNYLLMRELMFKISKKMNFLLLESEVNYIYNYSGITMSNISVNKKDFDYSDEVISKVLEEVIRDILLISGKNYSQDKEFMSRIYSHIKGFMKKPKYNIYSDNPLLSQIKSKFPVEFNLAILIANRLESKFGIRLDEGELAYIAIHFAISNERNKNNIHKKICIVCHYDISIGLFIYEKLKRSLNNIYILGVYPVRYLDIAINQDVDLIVSTLDIKSSKKQILYIDNVFDESIIENINKSFYEKREIGNIVSNIFNKDAFFKLKGNKKEEVILDICKKLSDRRFVDKISIDSILKRESISSTEVGNLVAIPHTVIDNGMKSIIGVAILDKAIIWDKQEVQLIFMVFLNLRERHNFLIFKYLYDFIKDEDGVKAIVRMCNFEKFISVLSKGG